MKNTEVKIWLSEVLPLHQRLTDVLVPLIETLISQAGIEYLSVNGRTKDISSSILKVKRKGYKNPKEQMTDLTGIRVITFFDAQVKKINDIIRSSFSVDEDNSNDNPGALGDDRIGYRSVHFVCSIGNNRSMLPEFRELGNLSFEIQIRTVLQHAWAELAHDRAYKFPGVLPEGMQRKLNLYAGMLEIVDSAFDDIASKIDEYRKVVSVETRADAGVQPLDSINTKSLLDDYLKEYGKIARGEVGAVLIEELTLFGIKTQSELKSEIEKNKDRIFHSNSTHYYGIVRDIMLFSNIDNYFKLSWRHAWEVLDHASYEDLCEKWGDRKIDKLLNKYHIDIDYGVGNEEDSNE